MSLTLLNRSQHAISSLPLAAALYHLPYNDHVPCETLPHLAHEKIGVWAAHAYADNRDGRAMISASDGGETAF